MAADHFRAKKLGLNFHEQKKQEAKLNLAESQDIPQRIVEWMNATLNGDHQKCTQHSWRQMQFFLKDGVALCKFINKLRAEAGMPDVKYSGTNSLRAFVALENIERFTKGAVEYGVSESESFTSHDLYDCHKGPFANVMLFLNSLGCEANRRGFQPSYKEPQPMTNGPSSSDT